MKIVCLGSMNVDHVYSVDKFIEAKETKACLGLKENAGGKGLNQSVAAAQTGVDVYHACYYGNGADILLDALKAGGVKMDLLEHLDKPNGHAIIQVDESGQNCIMIYGGTNVCLTEEYIDKVIDFMDKEDILLLQNETNLIAYAIEAAYAKGIAVAMNVAPIDAKAQDYPLEKLRYLVVNEVEGAGLAGVDDFSEIMNKLSEKYPDTAILMTLGGDGSWYKDGDREIRMGCCKKIKVVDTTAAGDTFLGYFLSGMLKNMDPCDALKLATHASAITIQSPGAAESIPQVDRVEAALASAEFGDIDIVDNAK